MWRKIDEKVSTLTCDDFEVNQIMSRSHDQNELLEFVSDVLQIKGLSQRIYSTVSMSLLNFAYLPCLVNSLVLMQPKKKSGGG